MPFLNTLLNLSRGTAILPPATENATPVTEEVQTAETEVPQQCLSPTEICDNGPIKVVLFPFFDTTRATKPHHFEPVEKDLNDSVVIKLGRPVKDKSGKEADVNSAPVERDFKNGKTIEHVWFKSKVVSRTHAEIWCKDGQLYIKDTSSSSGTFLNRLRLSPSGKESRPYPLKAGDTVQLGIDYQGRSEDVYKCVVIMINVASESVSDHERRKASPARFQNALRALLNTANPYASMKEPTCTGSNARVDCCICISAIAPCQAIFLSPCSHCYHYKCIQQLLEKGFMFQCPMCRQVANLNASVSMDSLDELAFEDEQSLPLNDKARIDEPPKIEAIDTMRDTTYVDRENTVAISGVSDGISGSGSDEESKAESQDDEVMVDVAQDHHAIGSIDNDEDNDNEDRNLINASSLKDGDMEIPEMGALAINVVGVPGSSESLGSSSSAIITAFPKTTLEDKFLALLSNATQANVFSKEEIIAVRNMLTTYSPVSSGI